MPKTLSDMYRLYAKNIMKRKDVVVIRKRTTVHTRQRVKLIQQLIRELKGKGIKPPEVAKAICVALGKAYPGRRYIPGVGYKYIVVCPFRDGSMAECERYAMKIIYNFIDANKRLPNSINELLGVDAADYNKVIGYFNTIDDVRAAISDFESKYKSTITAKISAAAAKDFSNICETIARVLGSSAAAGGAAAGGGAG